MTVPSRLPDHVDVAIVGAGPTGVTLAHALARHGIRVCVLERNHGVLPIPRAIHIDGETMRIFHGFGLAKPLLKVMRPGGQMQWVNANGDVLLVRKGVEGLGLHGWHNDYYYHQPEMESVIREELMRQPSAQLCEGWSLQSLTQDAEGVELSLQSTQGDAGRVRATYVVGCDGARSTVRNCIGCDDFEDLGEHQTWLVVDGVLERPLNLPEFSVQHCDPARPATSIFVNALRRRWELMLLPGEDPAAMVESERVWAMLERWVKPGQAQLERAATYCFHSLVARRWQQGRVFLAGDAAHQTPPFLGQGLCAAIRDVGNLAWKLVGALQGRYAPDAVLPSYGPERTPHAREFIALAVSVGSVIQELDPAKAAERDQRLVQEGLRFAFPSPVLGQGLHRAGLNETTGIASVVGTVAPQFELSDGRWTDDVAPMQWCLLATPAIAEDESLSEAFIGAGVALIAADTEPMQRWLATLGVPAALLRPDHYVYDVLKNAEEARAALAQIALLQPGLTPELRGSAYQAN